LFESFEHNNYADAPSFPSIASKISSVLYSLLLSGLIPAAERIS
jgi:hypothetical protein